MALAIMTINEGTLSNVHKRVFSLLITPYLHKALAYPVACSARGVVESTPRGKAKGGRQSTPATNRAELVCDPYAAPSRSFLSMRWHAEVNLAS